MVEAAAGWRPTGPAHLAAESDCKLEAQSIGYGTQFGTKAYHHELKTFVIPKQTVVPKNDCLNICPVPSNINLKDASKGQDDQ